MNLDLESFMSVLNEEIMAYVQNRIEMGVRSC
jgi:hypothetical protein